MVALHRDDDSRRHGVCARQPWLRRHRFEQVLTIHSGSQFFPANPVLDEAIREVLMSRADIPVDYYTEYIETDRFGPLASASLADYVRRKYEGRQIDVVIAMTNYALSSCSSTGTSCFPTCRSRSPGSPYPGSASAARGRHRRGPGRRRICGNAEAGAAAPPLDRAGIRHGAVGEPAERRRGAPSSACFRAESSSRSSTGKRWRTSST